MFDIKTAQISVSVNVETLEKVEELRGKKSRSGYINDLLTEKIGEITG